MYERLDRAIAGVIAIRSAKGNYPNLTDLYWTVHYELDKFSAHEVTLRKRLQHLRKEGVIEHVVGKGWRIKY